MLSESLRTANIKVVFIVTGPLSSPAATLIYVFNPPLMKPSLLETVHAILVGHRRNISSYWNLNMWSMHPMLSFSLLSSAGYVQWLGSFDGIAGGRDVEQTMWFAVQWSRWDRVKGTLIDALSFDATIDSHDLVMLNFFAPWCGHCKTLEGILKSVDDKLKKTNTSATIAFMDASSPDNREFAELLGIDGYPTLAVYKHGKRLADYSGRRTMKDIYDYLVTKSLSLVSHVESADDLTNYTEKLRLSSIFESDVLSITLALFPKAYDSDIDEEVSTGHGHGHSDDKSYFHDKDYTLFETISANTDLSIFLSSNSPELLHTFDIQKNTIVVITSQNILKNPRKIYFDEDTHGASLEDHVSFKILSYSLPSTLTYSKSVHPYIQHIPIKKHVLVFLPQSTHDLYGSLNDTIQAVATHFSGKLLFLLIDSQQYNMLQFFELTTDMLPHIIIADMSDPASMLTYVYDPNNSYSREYEDSIHFNNNDFDLKARAVSSESDESVAFNERSLYRFFVSYLSNTAVPHIRSEPAVHVKSDASAINSSHAGLINHTPGTVEVLIGANFQQKVMQDNNSDYFVYFTAPWCGYCKAVEPVVSNMATYYKHDKRLKIGKIDMTKNDVIHPLLHIRGFPAFYLFLGNDKNAPQAYDGERKMNLMTQFVANERTKYRKKYKQHTGSTS